MKYLFSLFLIFLSFIGVSQDTSFTSTPPDALSIWRQSPVLPDGVEADTIRARFKDGVYWIRVIYDGVYTPQMAGIKDDGTDQTVAFSRLFSKSYITTVKMSSDSTRKYTINSTLNIPSGKYLMFDNGVMFNGSGTINGGIIVAPYNIQLFDTTLTANPEKPSADRWSMQWWITSDTSKDISTTVRKVTSLISNRGNKKLYFPERMYKISRGGSPAQMILMRSGMDVFGDGVDRTIWKLNPSDLTNFRRMFTFDAGSSDVINTKIHDGTIDMSNVITSYNHRGAQGWVGDAQNAGIFSYSDNFYIKHSEWYNLKIINVTGDSYGVSKSSVDINIRNIQSS